jgi:hypothetical protein
LLEVTSFEKVDDGVKQNISGVEEDLGWKRDVVVEVEHLDY